MADACCNRGTSTADCLSPLSNGREPATVEEKYGDKQKRHGRPDAGTHECEQSNDKGVPHHETNDPSEDEDHVGDGENPPDLTSPHEEGVAEDDPLDEDKVSV